MANIFNIFFPKRMLGVDIGTSSIKVVEISRWGKGLTLENYGEIDSASVYKELLLDSKKSENSLSGDFVAEALKAILGEAKMKSRQAVFAIPDFSTFFTSFEIPPMTEKEIPEAIKYNASQFITLPIAEVALDWRIAPPATAPKNPPPNQNSVSATKSQIKVFLSAVPNQVVKEYQKTARLAEIELFALEAEALSIARAIAKNNKKTLCLVDIGVQSSTINIVDEGFLKRSYSFNFYSNKLTQAISSAIGIEYGKAEEIKNKEGLLSSSPGVAETLYPIINPLISEIRTISSEFYQTEQKNVEEIYLSGGTAALPGLKKYFEETLKKPVSIPNCFAEFLYPPILEELLKEMCPRFSVAVGAALAGLQI